MIIRHFSGNRNITTAIPDNEIWYTSTDGNVVTPFSTGFGANIISNTYENGKGIIKFDDSVTSIGRSCFQYCYSLTSIIIPHRVINIGNSAFRDCHKLVSVAIPNNVTSIDWYAFDGCSSLTYPIYNVHCFAYMPPSYSGVYTIPEGIEQIAGAAFDRCTSLTSVTIPSSVTSIGTNAFYGCSALSKTNYTGDIVGWGYIEFESYSANPMSYSHNFYINDQEIKNLIIPESVTSNGEWTFYKCSSLTSVTIPNSVTNIEKDVFNGCSSLITITCEATTPPTLGSSNNLSSVTAVYVPAESVAAYKTADGWSYYADKIQPIQ